MIKKKNPLAIKNRKIATLANKALKNKPKWKPAKGFKYLKDLEIGSKFKTASGLTGILLDISTNVKVKITDAQSIEEEDIKYYLGKKTIASKTEVKEVKWKVK